MYPTFNMFGVNEKLREHWHSLTPAEKAGYKSLSADETLPTVSPPTVSPSTLSPPTVSQPQPTPLTTPRPPPELPVAARPSSSTVIERGQTTIHKCVVCGKMFLNGNALTLHRRDVHGIALNTLETAATDAGEEVGGNATATISEQVKLYLLASFSNVCIFQGIALV